MNPQIILATVLFNVLALLSAFGATKKSSGAQSNVTVSAPCAIRGNHGVARWTVKTDPAMPPGDKSQITSITPSQMFAWKGVGKSVKLTPSTNTRLPGEQKWYALTGVVKGLKIEADGDIHIELVDSSGNKPGIVGAEIPPGAKWCQFRKLVFSWTDQKYPFHFKSGKPLNVVGRHVTMVTGKAFYDVDHAPPDRSNVRPKPFAPNYSVWEIHPVMGMTR